MARGEGHVRLAAVVSVLLGMTCAMMTVGLMARFRGAIGSPQHTSGAVFCAVFIAMAIGVRVPRQFAIWVSAFALRRFMVRRPRGGPSTTGPDPTGTDQSLHWLVLSVVALLAGILTAVLPMGTTAALDVYAWLIDRFVWSAVPFLALQLLIVFICVFLPGAALGLAAAFAHRLSCPHGTWQTRATGWLLIGASIGVAVASTISAFRARPDLILVAASLPSLAAALLAGLASSAHLKTTPHPLDADPAMLPQWSDRWPRLLRTSIIAVGGSAACTVAIWIRVMQDARGADFLPVCAMLFALGVGILVGGWSKLPRVRSIGGFGTACLVAGIDAACGSVVANHAASIPAVWSHVTACASVAIIGFAVAYGRQTLLRRVASRPAAGATILGNKLLCCALTVWVGVPAALMLVGAEATLILVAVSLVALGGALIIHEPGYSRRTRAARVFAVFGSIAAMIVGILYASPDNASRFSVNVEPPSVGAEADYPQ